MLWAAREVGSADFRDIRLSQRLVSLVDALSQQPGSSLPQALGKWKDVKAAYRFLDNPKVSADTIYATHRQATCDRAKGERVLLAVQDTSAFNFTLHRKTSGLGPIGKAGLNGFFLHSCLGVTGTGVPLGILAHQFIVRPSDSKGSRAMRKKKALEEKESYRWVAMTQKAAQGFPPDTKVVMVGDRESDIFDLFVLAQAERLDILIRAAWNRRVADSDAHILDAVSTAPILGTTVITVPRADDHPSREAVLCLQAASVALRPPPHRARERLPNPTLNALRIWEPQPPEGEEAIEWLLLTTLPVATLTQALQYLTWYTYRWRIERYHYILKSGCGIEELQLETAERLQRAVAVYSIVAWRLLWLTYQARQTPQAPCTVALTDSEWKALYATTHKTTAVPDVHPNIHTATRWIAQLGGFLGRKHDGEPGVKVLWRGMRRLQDIAATWELFHPPATYG